MLQRILRFLGVCPPDVGCYKTLQGGKWVCERCGC